MRVTKRQLRRLVREAYDYNSQNAWLDKLDSAIQEGPEAVADLYVSMYNRDADVYFDEDRGYCSRAGCSSSDLRQIAGIIDSKLATLSGSRSKATSPELVAIGRNLVHLAVDDVPYLTYQPVRRGGKIVGIRLEDQEGPQGSPMGHSSTMVTPGDAARAGTTLDKVIAMLASGGAKLRKSRPPTKRYASTYD